MRNQGGAAASLKAIGFALVSGLALAAPRIAVACSVCTAGRDEENQLAFLLSTIFMSVLPLAVIGTIVFVLWRRIRKLELEEQRPVVAPQPREALDETDLSRLAREGRAPIG